MASRSIATKVDRSGSSGSVCDLLVQLPVGLILRLAALVDPSEVHAVGTQLFELPGRPPQLAAPDRGGEVAEVVPEPEQDLAERLGSRRWIDLGQWELEPGQDPAGVQQHPMRPGSDLGADPEHGRS